MSEQTPDELRQQVETWRHKAVRRAIQISKLTGTIQAVTDLASEEITARTEWGDGYRAALADLQEVLREFGHLPSEWTIEDHLRQQYPVVPQPDPAAGPTVAECAANDRRWQLEKEGE